MASSMNGTGNNVDEIRYKSYLTQMERDQDAHVKEKEDVHRERITNIIGSHDDQEKTMRRDYEVKISEEAEALEQKLSLIRERNQTMTVKEKENGEHEAEKIHTQYTQKIEQEKRTGDEQITRLQAYYKKASEDLHHQFEKERTKVNHEKGKA